MAWRVALAVAASAGVAAAAAASVAGEAGLGGYFETSCGFSHRAMDDPIRLPRLPGRSHDHSFFGNTETDAFSTPATLRGGATTCDVSSDSSAYWAPTLFAGKQPVPATAMSVYYVRGVVGRVQPFPAGLRMIAGDMLATRPQSRSVTFWTCGSYPWTPTSKIPSCPADADLQLSVNFPSCWNGTQLDSADHMSHLAYPVAGRCPSSHPVALPEMILIVHYPAVRAKTAQLASGGQLTGHADFMNAWDQPTLARVVNTIVNAGA